MGGEGSLGSGEGQNLRRTEDSVRILRGWKSSRLKRLLTLVQVGLPRLVASVTLRGEVLGHPVGPGRRLGGFAVLPQTRTLAHAYKLGRLARI